ncbi:ribonuclease H [Porphyromonadaceae bacterium COT-184 OH4590]|nr:ribonuclease H [Porphyromonadaceae bacterium COT-184 OH4590]
MAKKRHYVVWKGRNIGIFDSWEGCKAQIDKFEGAVYKGFDSRSEAVDAFAAGIPDFRKAKHEEAKRVSLNATDKPTYRAIAVDAACGGNPGAMEYRGVWVDCGVELFHSKIYPEATNNIGEFLALVHVLALCKQQGWKYDIYSDSRNAILWVKHCRCKTKLEPNSRNDEVFDLISRAERWLQNNVIENKIIKWDTAQWGEIPADFGRK